MNVPVFLKRLSAVLLGLLLSGCGSYYTVSVDSLRDDELAAEAATCFLEPGNQGVPKTICCSAKSPERSNRHSAHRDTR